MKKLLLSVTTAIIAAISIVASAHAQAPIQQAALDATVVAALKNTSWSGTALGTNGAAPITLTITDVRSDGKLAGTFVVALRNGPSTSTLGDQVNAAAGTGTGFLNGKELVVTTAQGSVYKMSLNARYTELEGLYSTANQSGKVKLARM